MAHRLVLYGDGLLYPPHGFGELLLDALLLKAPSLAWQASLQGSDDLGVEKAFHEASWRLVGKAPQEVVLAFGATEIEKGAKAKDLLPWLQELLHLIHSKTQAEIALVALPLAFFSEGPEREEAANWNASLAELNSSVIDCFDLNTPVQAFFQEHRESLGEKRALHLAPNRLTMLGKLLLAQTVAENWPWPLHST